MRKSEELSNPNSCMSKARDTEMVFVLLARDPAAPVAIEAWARARVDLGKNKADDPQIKEAMKCIEIMEREGKLIKEMTCKGCGKQLLPENSWMEDGCPCNTERGVNHGNQAISNWRAEEIQRLRRELETVNRELKTAKSMIST